MEHQAKLFRSNVVCKLLVHVIGQTRRNLRARLNNLNLAANSNQQSDMTKHLLKHPTLRINFNKPEILCSAYNLKKLHAKESLLFRHLKPNINVDISLFTHYVCNTYIMY